MRKICCVLTVVLMLVASIGYAQNPMVDGTVVGDESFYGSALSIQNTKTHFGDAVQGDQVEAFGSEIDQVFATVSGDRLYVMVAGNLEWNFNKMAFFLDTVDGGHNTLDGPNLPTGVDGFCCLSDENSGALQRMNGLTFDAGFEADYFVAITNGRENALEDPNSPGETLEFWGLSAHYSDMTAGADADKQVVAAGMQLAPNGLPNVLRMNGSQDFAGSPYIPDSLLFGQTNPNHIGPQLPNLNQGELIDRNYAVDPAGGQCNPDDSGDDCLATELGFALDVAPDDEGNALSHRNFNNLVDLQVGLDNSNAAGVEGGSGAPWMTLGDPENVVTGVEFSIPLSEIGLSAIQAAEIGMTIFVNGDGYHFASNQFAGDGVLSGFLGGDGMGEFIGDLSGVNLANVDGNQFVTLSYNPPTPDCDFDGSGSCDIDDIDMLVAEIVAGTNDPTFDLNADDEVTLDDVTDENVGWLRLAGEQEIGPGLSYLAADINLDTFVDGLDFIEWNMNKFQDGGLWSLGDVNADGFTDGLDFIIWNQLKFTSSTDGNAAVPEPSGILALLVGTLLLVRRSRRLS